MLYREIPFWFSRARQWELCWKRILLFSDTFILINYPILCRIKPRILSKVNKISSTKIFSVFKLRKARKLSGSCLCSTNNGFCCWLSMIELTKVVLSFPMPMASWRLDILQIAACNSSGIFFWPNWQAIISSSLNSILSPTCFCLLRLYSDLDSSTSWCRSCKH